MPEADFRPWKSILRHTLFGSEKRMLERQTLGKTELNLDNASIFRKAYYTDRMYIHIKDGSSDEYFTFVLH